MLPQQEDELLAKFPRLFAGWRDEAAEGSAPTRIECGDGWIGLLDALCEAVQWETDHGDAPQLVVRRVKEKLGGLRFQTAPGSDIQRGMILLATRLSERICEVCGAPGVLLREDGWMRTLCSHHAGANAER